MASSFFSIHLPFLSHDRDENHVVFTFCVSMSCVWVYEITCKSFHDSPWTKFTEGKVKKKKKKSKNFVFLDYQFYFLPKWKIELVTWRNRNRRFREQTPWIFGRWFSLLTTSVQRKPLNHFSTSITYNITANYTILARLTKITQVEQDHKKLSIRIFFSSIRVLVSGCNNHTVTILATNKLKSSNIWGWVSFCFFCSYQLFIRK